MNLEGECEALMEDEITVLSSIYSDLFGPVPNPTDKPGKSLLLTIPITLPQPVDVQLEQINRQMNAGPSNDTVLTQAELSISNLPALNVRVFLPPLYPLAAPPKITSIRASLPHEERANWLSRRVLNHAQEKATQMWKEDREVSGEGVGVLWRWWEWIGTGEFLRDLELLNDTTLKLTVPPMLSSSAFHTSLKTFNAAQIHADFEKTAFSCTICFENRKGKSCIQMPGCGCVFCAPCLNSCWSLAIQEGTLESVSCPSVHCTKRRATRDHQNDQVKGLDKEEIGTTLVESVVGKDLRIRWETLKEKRRAEIDPTYTTCPQPFCQAAVPPPQSTLPMESIPLSTNQKHTIRLADITNTTTVPNPLPTPPATPDSAVAIPTAKEDRWDRYRICPSCHFSFCLYCSATWHGPHTPCAFPQTSALVIEYLSYPEDSEGRRRMEMQKGKTNLERMVAKWKEDEENKKWLNERTRACPGCAVRVEKSHGCNHMTCGRCNAHFCYRCGESISPTDPYAHYRRPGAPCFEKLFDAEEIARFERETAMREGLGLPFMEAADADEWRQVRGLWEW